MGGSVDPLVYVLAADGGRRQRDFDSRIRTTQFNRQPAILLAINEEANPLAFSKLVGPKPAL